jgi:hypothetical protein
MPNLSIGLGLNEYTAFYITAGGALLNICILVGSDGTDYIYRYNSFGLVDDDTANDGTLFYEFVVNGSDVFTLGFGTTGNTHLTDVDEILVYSAVDNKSKLAEWDDGLKKYTFTDTEWGTSIRDEYDLNGEFELCVGMYVLPNEFIHYTFEEIEIGEA